MTDRDQAQVAGQRPVPSPDTGEQSGEVAPALVANPSKAQQLLGWKATRGLNEIVSTAWNWMQKQPQVATR